jgi:opacity protein-like surface antigen
MLVLLCSLTVAVVAQVPTSGYAFFGYSLNHGRVDPATDSRTLNGWEASVEFRMLPHVGLVADFGQQFGHVTFFPNPFLGIAPFNIDVRTEQYLFGPRASFRVGPVRPFVHFLVGAGHVRERNRFVGFEDSDTSFAYTVGGGVDYRLVGPLNVRVQLESLNTNFFNDWQHNTRFSTGLSFRF